MQWWQLQQQQQREKVQRQEEEPNIDTMQAYISGLQKDLSAMKLAQQQQQQQPQQPRQRPVRVANASVTPPAVAPWKKSYAEAACPADWQCCMTHSGKHATCFRCGAARPLLGTYAAAPMVVPQPQQPKPQIEPSAKRVRFDKEALDKQLEADPLEDQFGMALDDVAALRPELDWSLPVAGPCVAAVHEMLDALPATHASNKDSSQDEAVALARKGAESAMGALSTAQQDLSLAAGMSSKMQELLATAVTEAQSAVQTTKEALELAEKSTSSLAKLSHAALDKVRALAQEKHEHWLARMDRKTLAVQEATEALSSDLDAAIRGLNLQKEELKEKSKSHERAWLAHKEDSLAAHATRVQELRQLMAEKPPNVSALDGAAVVAVMSTDSVSEMEKLRQQMTALSSQMQKQAEDHSAQLRAAARMHDSKMEQWKLHCEGISAESSLLRASLPPAAETMNQEETQQRLAHVAAVKVDTSPHPLVSGAAAASSPAEKVVAVDGQNY